MDEVRNQPKFLLFLLLLLSVVVPEGNCLCIMYLEYQLSIIFRNLRNAVPHKIFPLFFLGDG